MKENPAPRSVCLLIPAYNEEEALPILRTAIEAWRAKQPWYVETIIINDGSSDRTQEILNEWAATAPWLKVLHLSRNFGHQPALTAGLDFVTTDVVIITDADLQDPLEVIPQMVEKYVQGFDIVYGQRLERKGESWLKLCTAWLFYRFMRWLIDPRLPADTGDFRLVSQKCVTAIRAMRETHRFMRGMFTWTGFAQTALPYQRAVRCAGVTKYSYRKMALFAWNAVLSFSPLPLRLILLQGLLVAGFGACYGVYSILRWYFVGDTATGWPTLVVLLCLIGGAILISLGLIGEYVSRIYEESKARPLYLVADKININGKNSSAGIDIP